MKEKAVLPPIKHQANSKPDDSESHQRQNKLGDSASSKRLPPVNYYYVSGRYKVCQGGFWNPDLNTDYNAWIKHRKRVLETKQHIDNEGITESHERYMKFRRRIQKQAELYEKNRIQRQNKEMFSRVNHASTDIDDKHSAYAERVEEAMRKRAEFGRQLFQKKIARENTLLENRIKAARPWATVEDMVENYNKLQKTGLHYRKFKNLAELEWVFKRNQTKAEAISLGRSTEDLHHSSGQQEARTEQRPRQLKDAESKGKAKTRNQSKVETSDDDATTSKDLQSAEENE